MESLGYGADYSYNPAYAHPVSNTYLPDQLAGSKFLLDEDDGSEKVWDEKRLKRWEKEINGGKPWSERPLDSNELHHNHGH